MKKFSLMFLILALAGASALAGGKKEAKETTVTGWVSDSMCGAKNASAGHEECVTKCIDHGAKAVLVTEGKDVLTVENPDTVKGHEGHNVQVRGHVNESAKSIHIAELKMLDGAKDKK
jgi:hypothetical protein